jgi:hypothetical protein
MWKRYSAYRAAAKYSLIATAKLNDVDPRAWLADVIARIADHPARRLDELPPWNWRDQPTRVAAQPKRTPPSAYRRESAA